MRESHSTTTSQILLQRSKALATVLLARTDSYPGVLASPSSHRLNNISTNSRQISTSTSSTRLNRSTSRLNQIQPPITSAPLRRVVSSPDKPCTAKPKTAKPCTAKLGPGKSYSDYKPALLYGEEVKKVAPLKR